MASCEIILDVTNYDKIPGLPTVDERAVLGDAELHQRLRDHENAKKENQTKFAFLVAVRWFLKDFANFDLPVANADPGDPGDPRGRDGLWLLDKYSATIPASAATAAATAADEAAAKEAAKATPPKPAPAKVTAVAVDTPNIVDTNKARFLTVCGLLIAESQFDALSGKSPQMLSRAAGDEKDETVTPPIYVSASFKNALNRALAEYNTYPDLFKKVYETLKQKSEIPGGTSHDYKFRARQIAEIGRALVAERVDPKDAQFKARFERALSVSLSGATEGRASSIDIDLPDLEAGTEADIIIDNVKALSAIYFSAMLEEMKLFAVMDKVVEQFMTGALPIKRSSAGDPLYRHHREAPLRINEFDRRGLYARSFGVAQGSVDEEMPNREFNDLWIRFLSAVSIFGREQDSTEMKRVSQEQIFKTARDLAVNLSYHGYGLAHFAAIELQSLIKTVKDTLSHPDVLAAYGVRDVWQLCERVSNMYLGGAPNGVRHRTMAQAGAAIIQWLALSGSSLVGSFRNLNVDDTLRSHVERWLSVTGTPDTQTEKYSEPVALTSQPTIPSFAVPSGAGGDAIRDALARVNLPTTPQN
jgi:hypothetical protein